MALEENFENINESIDSIKEASEKLDPKALGVEDILKYIRQNNRMDKNIKYALQRSSRNEEQTSQQIRGINSVLRDSLDLQYKLLSEITNLSNVFKNSFNVDQNNLLPGNAKNQKNKKGFLPSLGSAAAGTGAAALGLLGLGSLFGGTAISGPANASSISKASPGSSSYVSPYTNTTSTGGMALPSGSIEPAEEVKRIIGGYDHRAGRESAGLVYEGNIGLEDLLKATSKQIATSQRAETVPHINPETGKKRFAAGRHQNPGAKWESASDAKYGALGYTVLNDPERNHIQSFPSVIHGAASAFDLLHNSSNYKGKSADYAMRNWRGRPSPVPEALARYGRLSEEFYQDEEAVLQTAQEMFNHEGRVTPLTREEVKMAYDMFKAGGIEPYLEQHPEAIEYFKKLYETKQAAKQGKPIEEIQKIHEQGIPSSPAKTSDDTTSQPRQSSDVPSTNKPTGPLEFESRVPGMDNISTKPETNDISGSGGERFAPEGRQNSDARWPSDATNSPSGYTLKAAVKGVLPSVLGSDSVLQRLGRLEQQLVEEDKQEEANKPQPPQPDTNNLSKLDGEFKTAVADYYKKSDAPSMVTQQPSVDGVQLASASGDYIKERMTSSGKSKPQTNKDKQNTTTTVRKDKPLSADKITYTPLPAFPMFIPPVGAQYSLPEPGKISANTAVV